MSTVERLAELLSSSRYRRQTLADGSGVVVDMEAMKVLSLNRSGMVVLDALADGVTRIDLLERRLTETFDVDPETAARDLSELLAELDRVLTAPAAP